MHLTPWFNKVSLRLAIAVFLPSLVGVLALVVQSWPGHVEPLRLLRGMAEALLAANIVVGVQSLLYAVLMELVVLRWVRSLPGVAAISGVLGMAAGFTLQRLAGIYHDNEMVWIGIAVGVVVGVLLWLFRPRVDADRAAVTSGKWKPWLAIVMLYVLAVGLSILLAASAPFGPGTHWLGGVTMALAPLAVLVAMAVSSLRLFTGAAAERSRLIIAVGLVLVIGVSGVMAAAMQDEKARGAFHDDGSFYPEIESGC